jgi:hypothetical protein
LPLIWIQAIRKTYEDGGIEEMVSTRRLCHIFQTFSIFGNRVKAIELCVNRFDVDTIAVFLDLYGKMMLRQRLLLLSLLQLLQLKKKSRSK